MSHALPDVAETRLSLQAHAAAKGAEVQAKYGPVIGWSELEQILQDRACVRYPTEIVFEADPLQAGELAHPAPKGDRPEDGFTMCVHPALAPSLPSAVYAVLYQLVLVNYGAFATAADAEAFGAAALGLDVETYYQALCELADRISPPPSP